MPASALTGEAKAGRTRACLLHWQERGTQGSGQPKGSGVISHGHSSPPPSAFMVPTALHPQGSHRRPPRSASFPWELGTAGCFGHSEPGFFRFSPKTLVRKLKPMDNGITSPCDQSSCPVTGSHPGGNGTQGSNRTHAQPPPQGAPFKSALHREFSHRTQL